VVRARTLIAAALGLQVLIFVTGIMLGVGGTLEIQGDKSAALSGALDLCLSSKLDPCDSCPTCPAARKPGPLHPVEMGRVNQYSIGSPTMVEANKPWRLVEIWTTRDGFFRCVADGYDSAWCFRNTAELWPEACQELHAGPGEDSWWWLAESCIRQARAAGWTVEVKP